MKSQLLQLLLKRRKSKKTSSDPVPQKNTPPSDGKFHPEADGSYKVKTIEFADLKDTTRQGRRIPIKVHYPVSNGSSQERFPVIVFSHGGGGHWDANYAQARHLATHGYCVLCLEHVGSNTEKMRQGGRFSANLQAISHDSAEVLGRPKDVSFALDRAEEWQKSHPVLKGCLDLGRVGMIGHSFGAYTTLVVCGAQTALDWITPTVAPGKGLAPPMRDPRIRVGVALSPQGPGEPFFLETSYKGVNIPLLGITGSKDDKPGSTPENRLRCFALIPKGDKYLVWLENADHTAFSDPTGSGKRSLPSQARENAQPIVRAATLLFFNGYLRDNKAHLKSLTAQELKPLCKGVISSVRVQLK
jgi:predicted dienelactone hydrolase